MAVCGRRGVLVRVRGRVKTRRVRRQRQRIRSRLAGRQSSEGVGKEDLGEAVKGDGRQSEKRRDETETSEEAEANKPMRSEK